MTRKIRSVLKSIGYIRISTDKHRVLGGEEISFLFTAIIVLGRRLCFPNVSQWQRPIQPHPGAEQHPKADFDKGK
jgi:hypothetical protein